MHNNTPHSLEKAAVVHASFGWPVFPLIPGDKRPLTENGFKDATLSEDRIRDFWQVNTRANVGIATGKQANLVVIDVDKKSGGLETLELIKDRIPHTTLTARTGNGGLHLYFQYPEGMESIRNKVGLLPGIDVRADGGYVVAPPSVTTGTYEFINDYCSPLAVLPEFFIQLLTQQQPTSTSSEPTIVVEGGRNHYLTQAAGRMQRMGLLTLNGLHSINERDCNPPLSEWEVNSIFNSVSRYEPSERIAPSDDDKPHESLVVAASDLTSAMIEHISDKAKVKGEPTGIEGLDVLLGGGKRLGEVTCWHAEAKTGKNTLWHKLMHTWLVGKVPLGYASRELTPETEVLPNLLSLAHNENAWLAEMTAQRIQTYVASIESWPLYFARGYGHFPIEELRVWVSQLKEKGVQYFWFDHLHYMLEDPEDHKEASKLVKEIKTLAKTENIHVDIIIQPNKLAEGQQLSLNSIKGGSAMGQAIDNLLVIERVRDANLKNVCRVTLKAARSKLARLGSIYLQYNAETTDFIELLEDEQKDNNSVIGQFVI